MEDETVCQNPHYNEGTTCFCIFMHVCSRKMSSQSCFESYLFLTEVTQSIQIPVLIGSGVTHDNVEQYLQASAMIIGSHFKKGGHWANGVDAERIKRFMGKMRTLRE